MNTASLLDGRLNDVLVVVRSAAYPLARIFRALSMAFGLRIWRAESTEGA
jgi:hypothetical protein